MKRLNANAARRATKESLSGPKLEAYLDEQYDLIREATEHGMNRCRFIFEKYGNPFEKQVRKHLRDNGYHFASCYLGDNHRVACVCW